MRTKAGKRNMNYHASTTIPKFRKNYFAYILLYISISFFGRFRNKRLLRFNWTGGFDVSFLSSSRFQYWCGWRCRNWHKPFVPIFLLHPADSLLSSLNLQGHACFLMRPKTCIFLPWDMRSVGRWSKDAHKNTYSSPGRIFPNVSW